MTKYFLSHTPRLSNSSPFREKYTVYLIKFHLRVQVPSKSPHDYLDLTGKQGPLTLLTCHLDADLWKITASVLLNYYLGFFPSHPNP